MIFKAPNNMAIAGCASSGKSHLFYKILKNKEKVFDPPTSKVMYCYGIWRTLYDQIELPFVEFHELPNMEEICAFTNGSHCLVILDDLMAEVSKSTQVQQLFTLGSHHLNVSI